MTDARRDRVRSSDVELVGAVITSAIEFLAALLERHQVTEDRIRCNLIDSGCRCPDVIEPTGLIPLTHLIAWEEAHLDQHPDPEPWRPA